MPPSAPCRASARGHSEQNIIDARALICAIAEGRPYEPDFAFGHAITQTIDAVQRSVDERRCMRIKDV